MNTEAQTQQTKQFPFTERELVILHNLVVNEHNDLYNRDENRNCDTPEGRQYIADLQALAQLLYEFLERRYIDPRVNPLRSPSAPGPKDLTIEQLQDVNRSLRAHIYRLETEVIPALRRQQQTLKEVADGYVATSLELAAAGDQLAAALDEYIQPDAPEDTMQPDPEDVEWGRVTQKEDRAFEAEDAALANATLKI